MRNCDVEKLAKVSTAEGKQDCTPSPRPGKCGHPAQLPWVLLLRPLAEVQNPLVMCIHAFLCALRPKKLTEASFLFLFSENKSKYCQAHLGMEEDEDEW